MLKYNIIRAIEEMLAYMNLQVDLNKLKKFLIKSDEWRPSQLFFYLYDEVPKNKNDINQLYKFVNAIKEFVEVDAYLTSSP